MTDKDRFKDLESKLKQLENDNNKLENAITYLTEAFMILIEKEENMSEPDFMGPGFMANN